MTPLFFGIALVAAFATSGTKNENELSDTQPEPPHAKRVDRSLESHEQVRNDPYFWMRDDEREDPEILAHLEKENAYTKAMLAGTEDAQESLFQEIIGRIKQDDNSVPYFVDGYWHYVRYEEGKEHPIYCRKQESLDAAEEVLLDANAKAEAHDYYKAVSVETTRKGDVLAWAEDTLSRRVYDIRIRNLETGEVYPEVIVGTSGNLTWANGSDVLFYVKKEEGTLRDYQIWRHRVGTDPKDDVMIYEEEDESFYVGLYRTKSNKFVVIHSSSTLMEEARFVSADEPEGEFWVFLTREREHEYQIAHAFDRFYVRTNYKAKNFRLMSVPEDKTQDKTAWEEVIAHREDVLLEGVELFKNYLAVSEQAEANTYLRVIPWNEPEKAYKIDFQEPAYVAWLGDNPNFESDVVRFGYTSLATPNAIYDFDMKTKKRELKKQQEVLGGFDVDEYKSHRLWATARDGTKIPISLVHRKDLDRSQPQPLYLYGYGSYGLNVPAHFSSARLSILDRGLIFAIAHIRGGNEMGRRWYDDGKLMKKRNTFTDFIDSAKFLHDEGWSKPAMTIASGGSAGGLLMGAIANMAPERFGTIVASVPFVDVVTTMLDDSIPLTTFEYDEWGNPNEKATYEYMLSYSPYDNVKEQDYPHIFVFTGLHDSQVQYWEPAKWVARLRRKKTDSNKLLFRVDMEAGHSGAAGRFKQHRETAIEYSFLFDVLQIPLPG